jgi:hypothetical protein
VSKNQSTQGTDLTPSAQPVSTSILTPPVVLQTYDDAEWERFVLEWVEGATPAYVHFDRIGGAGDKGRDIVAYTGQPNTPCDLDVFQCKHYDHPIMPSEIWRELGKLCVYTERGDYRVPRKYRIVAPRGVGGSLGDLLTKPDDLRRGLIQNWDSKCRDSIIAGQTFPLAGSLLTYVQSFDFTIVGYIPVNQLLEQHKRTSHWGRRFPPVRRNRPEPGAVPAEAADARLLYVRRLLEAYSEHAGTAIADPDSLQADSEHHKHFGRNAEYFWSAECLNRFYREAVSLGAFDNLKTQVFDGVIETAERSPASGLDRLSATLEQAVRVQLADDDCKPYIYPRDVKGVCHHLANDDKLKWVLP